MHSLFFWGPVPNRAQIDLLSKITCNHVMYQNTRFEPQFLDSLVGGFSAIDFTRLKVKDLAQANEFIEAYGYDYENEDDLAQLWAYHRRAVDFIERQLLESGEAIPEAISDSEYLKDLRYLLIYASTKDTKEDSLQKWACAILRVMHVIVHIDNDLFTSQFPHIQNQVIKPIGDHVSMDPKFGTVLGSDKSSDSIPLQNYEVKAFKEDDSAIIKLLVKPEAVAFRLLDKVGFRFVTHTIFDVFRVMRYMVRSHLVSLPQFIPDQSNNTLYPVNLFLELMETFPEQTELSSEEVDEKLKEKFHQEMERAEFKEKPNAFSGPDFKFVKFVSRRRVRVTDFNGKSLTFFYPFEVQIMDNENYLKSLTGPQKHDEYKKRQTRRARARVLGLNP
ncbi:MAG: TIGR04552 family protein [Bdellovibrionaceae bacterium]|nr:TIGR04552 family protein [Pseudobdellovibrionaceae bacterium]